MGTVCPSQHLPRRPTTHRKGTKVAPPPPAAGSTAAWYRSRCRAPGVMGLPCTLPLPCSLPPSPLGALPGLALGSLAQDSTFTCACLYVQMCMATCACAHPHTRKSRRSWERRQAGGRALISHGERKASQRE